MTSPAPDYEASLDFLRRWAPEGPWVLTSIEPDQKGIDTATFRPETEKEMKEWLETQGEYRNIYFHVNPVLRDLDSKARREDVAALAWLHVDIDPRAGEDLTSERERALKLLRQPPGDLPPPTCIVFSGGGYQGFWKLAEPVPIDGDLAAAEEAKRYNLQIELLFSADNCHNVDRIMRLPGTINRPNAVKRRKGRKAELAAVVEWRDDRTYSIELFTAAPSVQCEETGFGAGTVLISGNVERFSGVHELPKKVPDWCRVLIVQGCDPDDPTKYESRSEALFAVCCELVRCDLTDDQIYAVVTDPDFGISASVLDKGASQEKYAVRQIERARENAVDPWLRKMNDRHAVIGDIGGKCRVISEVYDHSLKRSRISRQTFEDIRNRYLSTKIEIGTDKNDNPVRIPLGKWWLEHEHRREFDSMGFIPGREIKGVYNMWKGFSCEAIPGCCDKFLDHVRNNVCNGVVEHYEYLMGWLARCTQQPDSPGYAAVVMRGVPGSGKSFFVKSFGSLWGRHFMQVTDPKHLVGSFNAHLRDCVVLFGDEAFYAGDKRHESILKMLITEEMLTIEAKGIDAEASANYVHLFMASNDSWVVPAGFGDRRFFVLDVSHRHARDNDYFGTIQHELDNGGREALLHHLLNYDLRDFEVRDIPATEALQEQKLMSMSGEQDWWLLKLRDGRLLEEDDSWGRVCTHDLLYDYAQYFRSFGSGRKVSASKLGQFLSEVCPGGWPKREQVGEPHESRGLDGTMKTIKRPYFYVFPTLEECRSQWDERFGIIRDWEEVEDSEPVEIPF